MELVLVRHGLPERDETSSNPPLSAIGQHQAERAGAWLMRDGPFDAVYASTMRRAIETADAYCKASGGKACTQEERLVEFDRASGRYIPMEELKRTDYPAWKAYVDGGHTVDIVTFSATVVTAMEEIIARHRGERVVIFCHGGVINVWTAHVLGMPARLFFEPDYTSIHRYLCASSGQRNLVSLNERAHLLER